MAGGIARLSGQDDRVRMRGFQGLVPELSPLRNEAPPLVDSLSKTKNIVVVKTRAELWKRNYQNPLDGLYTNTLTLSLATSWSTNVSRGDSARG